MKKRPIPSLVLSFFFTFQVAVLAQAPQGIAQNNGAWNFPPPPLPPGKTKYADVIPGRYIVQFASPPLSVYQGGLPDLPPTHPGARKERKLEASHPDSIRYLEHLRAKQEGTLRAMEKTLGRGLGPIRFFKAAYNGAAVKMSPAEARRVAKLPEVAAVIPDRLRQLHTDNGPQWIGADDIWGGAVSLPTQGEGIVIGVIDTGINPANPSFFDVGDDGHDHVNPRGRYYGFCDPGDPYYTAGFCNDKLIGAYDFTVDSGIQPVLYDNTGHGSHTASTAAGNVVDPAEIVTPTITISRPISGVAPHANIISYKACLADGCPLSSLLAAIDQATLDGVDVINYSIGGNASDPWSDADSEAFLNARQAGVFVATSAGNNGPESETLGSPGNAPWLLTVGSSSHDRSFVNSLTNLTSSGASLSDIAGKSVSGALAARSIVYAGNYGDALCLNPFAAGTFSDQIVVCDRGTNARVEKGLNVWEGGAGGMVLANDAANGDSLSSDAHVLPAVHITYADGMALKTWLAAGTGHQAAISATTADEKASNGDIMSSFSSRGANAPLLSVIKPDVSAPGQDILAADGIDNAAVWGMESGTSMSSPHAAGAAALLLALHPAWSPAGIQSALMTAADPTVLKEDGLTAADPFDTGTGRIDVSAAARTGFILNETLAGYTAANPALGGDPKGLNIPSLGRENFVQSTTWYRTLTSTANTSWTASVINPPGVTLAVSPTAFSLAPGQTQQIAVTANAAGAVYDSWLFGGVVLTPADADTATARLPVALRRTVSNVPRALRYNDVRKYSSAIEKNIEAMAIPDLTVSRHGLTPAAIHTANLGQDPTPGNPYDGADGACVVKINVPPGAKRLVTEILETDSPDIDIFVWQWTDEGWVHHCTSNSSSSIEYCSVSDPPAGEYSVYIQNFEASDPDGSTLDKVEMAAAVVPEASAGNLSVSLANGGTSVPAGQFFDLKISWSLPEPETHWYGLFGLGTDAAHPDNLGRVDLDLHVQTGGLFFPVRTGEGKTTIIFLN